MTRINLIPDKFKQVDWTPNKNEISINLTRILLRISEKPSWYKQNGKPINNYSEQFI